MPDTPSAIGNQPAEINHFILDMYRHIGTIPQDTYKAWALDGLKQVIPFDSALWAEGAEFGTTIFDAYLHNSVHPASVWLEDYAQFKEVDPLALAAFENKGITIHDADLMPREAWLSAPQYAPFCHKHQIAYSLCTMDYDPTTTLVEVISIYRADSECPYTDEEKQRMQFLFPHLLETRRRNLQAGTGPVLPILDDVAICEANGLLHHAGEQFVATLQKAFPDWHGPHLPQELVSVPGQKGTAANRCNKMFSDQPVGAAHLISTHEYAMLDTLTPAEYRVAKLLIGGLSYQDGAVQLAIGISTFNKHANKVYRKLKVDGRTELAHRFGAQLG